MKENLDLLVKLYAFEADGALPAALERQGIAIRRALPAEMHIVCGWVEKAFGGHWASECAAAFSNHPATCFIAVQGGEVIGFACCEATAPDFFGPTGVAPQARGHAVGTALLHAALAELKARGYAYAIIGNAGPAEFYWKACRAVPIPGSDPGFYKGML